MDAADGSGGSDIGTRRGALRAALAGLEASVVGTFFLLGWLMLGSLWSGRSIWLMPNLFATTFYGGSVYRNHFLRASWTGVALIFVVYGILGVLWGSIWRERRQKWLALLGAIAGLAVYYLFFGLVWKHVNPLVAVYAPARQLQIGHVLWGILLARSPMYARRIANSTSAAHPPTHAAEPQEAAPAVRSGEVIQ
jgi:hypothetical protein